jgi:hypothetical protein
LGTFFGFKFSSGDGGNKAYIFVILNSIGHKINAEYYADFSSLEKGCQNQKSDGKTEFSAFLLFIKIVGL